MTKLTKSQLVTEIEVLRARVDQLTRERDFARAFSDSVNEQLRVKREREREQLRVELECDHAALPAPRVQCDVTATPAAKHSSFVRTKNQEAARALAMSSGRCVAY